MTDSQKLDYLIEQMHGMEDRIERVEDQIQGINSRLDKVESNTNALKAGQKNMGIELKKISERVEATYELALDAWGQSTENRVILNAL